MMKKLFLNLNKIVPWPLFALLFFVFQSQAAFAEFPQRVGYVNDYAKVLSTDAFLKVDKIASELDKKVGVELTVVTLDSVDGQTMDELRATMGPTWHLDETQNSIVMLFLMKDRLIGFITTPGFQRYLSKRQIEAVEQRYIFPYMNFEKWDINDGVIYGVYSLAAIIAQKDNIKLSEHVDLPQSLPINLQVKQFLFGGAFVPSVAIIFVIGALFVIFIAALFVYIKTLFRSKK